MNALKNNLERLRTDYNSSSGINSVLGLIRTFEDKNDCKVVILDSHGNLNFITSLYNQQQDTMRLRAIKEVIDEWTSNPKAFLNIKKSDKSFTYIFKNRAGDIKNIVCAVPDNSVNEVIFAVSSLQPVDEASAVINEFFIYIFIGAVILIIILSIIYSNMISKPLIRLNNSATKMANLDFSEKCEARSSDEIGNLGATLNFLSENLVNSLNSLKAANEKLTADIEKERELEKMRKEFVAGVSHELKTPISLIEGYAEALKDNVAAENEKESYLDIIIDESKNMGNLVSEMLDLSRLEYGKLKLSIESFDINTLINSTIKKYSNVLSEKEIQLSVITEGIILVYGDRHKIEQVLNNLFTNAIRYVDMPKTIFIRTMDEEDHILIEVENSGQHISEDEMNKIWEKFYRIDKSRNRHLGGTGLGLSIVKNILLLHESKFGIQNTEKGVKFYFTLKKA